MWKESHVGRYEYSGTLCLISVLHVSIIIGLPRGNARHAVRHKARGVAQFITVSDD